MALILKGRAKLKGSTVIGKRPYAIDGVFNPELVLDFQKDFYRTNSVSKTFANAITHTRASTATYVDSTGTLQTAAINEPRLGHHVYNGTAWVNEGLLHESEARTNTIIRSEEFENTAWNKERSSITQNAITAPDGSMTADKLVEDTTSTNNHRVRTTSFISYPSGSTVTNSVFVKAAERTWVNLSDGGSTNSSVFFNLATGTFGTAQAGVLSRGAVYHGNDWWRIFYTCTLVGTASNPFINIAIDNNNFTYTGDGTSGIFIWGAQGELAPTVSSYIPTAGTTVTRSADVLTIPAANLPYPEPVVIGPELVTNGTFDTDISGWLALGGSISWLNGKLLLTEDGADGVSARAYQQITTEVGKVYRVTFDVGAISLSNARIVASDNLNFGGKPQVVGSQNTSGELVFVAQTTATNILLLTPGSTARTLEFDNISVREINPLALSIQMDGRVTYADTDNNNEVLFVRWLKDLDNRIQSFLNTNSSPNRLIFYQESINVADQVDFNNAYSPDILVPFNIAARHGSTFVNGAVDGTALTANTTPTSLPDLSATNLQLGYLYNGTIRTFRMWVQDIGDTGLVEATEPSLVPSLSLTFDGTENSFIVNDWSA